MSELIYSIDFSILDFIRENLRCGFLDVFMRIFTVIGEGGALWIVIALAALCTKKHRFTGLMLAAALIAILIVGEISIKHIVQRDRPFVQNPEITVYIKPPSSYSFPSGHTFSSFGAATVIFIRSRKRRAVGIAAIVTAVLIGFSRLYFYVHFPTDVLCGMILGIITGTAVYFAMRGLEKNTPEDTGETAG